MKYIMLVAVFSVMASSAKSEPRYRLDKSERNVIAISNITDQQGCTQNRLSGVITTRSFSRNSTSLSSVTVETKNGERSYIVVDLSDVSVMSMADASWINTGLQTLTKIGGKVKIEFLMCGAAGRVWYLKSISK
jgi:anti-anti-sigma regulatory factor